MLYQQGPSHWIVAIQKSWSTRNGIGDALTITMIVAIQKSWSTRNGKLVLGISFAIVAIQKSWSTRNPQQEPAPDPAIVAIQKSWSKAWERQQCVGDEWSGESFPLYGQQCRIVNFCSGGKIVPRVACHKKGKTWVIQG